MNKNNPKISIITVVYNCENTIERTIRSVLAQNYPHLEYIIIDGKSTDNTLSVINKYRDQISHITSEKDSGIYNAMNKGIKVASGDLIGMLNADDWLEENVLHEISQSYKENDFDILHGNITFVGDANLYRKPRFKNWMPFWIGMPYFHPTYYVKKEIYRDLIYDENYRVIADYKFTMECILKKYTFFYLDTNIAYFSMGGASSSFWIRIKEGHRIRRELGFGFFKTVMSSLFRIGIEIKGVLFSK